jgi:hypothetical protein
MDSIGDCGQLGGFLLAATAALGYWVLRHCEKDGPQARWAGRIVGWTLVFFGLFGFVCRSVSRAIGAERAMCSTRLAPGRYSVSGEFSLPPGHPPIDDSDKK